MTRQEAKEMFDYYDGSETNDFMIDKIYDSLEDTVPQLEKKIKKGNEMTTFETAQVGDKVYSIVYGWDTINKIDNTSEYTIRTMKGKNYTNKGYSSSVQQRTLFWDEIIVIAPCKPLPQLEVDAKVLVWDFDKENAEKRHFSNFTKENRMVVFSGGKTSWSAEDKTIVYSYWEVL